MILRIYTDGGARGNPGPAATGVHVIDESGTTQFDVGTYLGTATNNEAEFQAFIAAATWIKARVHTAESQTSPITALEFLLDSKLVVEQLMKRWKIKEPRMLSLAQTCWRLLEEIAVPYTINHIPREKNAQADALVNQALDAHTD